MESKGKGSGYTLDYAGLEELFNLLSQDYILVAPRLEDGYIKYGKAHSLKDLPFGFKTYELAGFYRIEDGVGYFTYPRPINSLKDFLHPPKLLMLTVRKKEQGLEFEANIPTKRLCFFDVRACDLSALKVLDRVFWEKNNHPDPYYLSLREDLFIVAVSCLSFTQTCFCKTMGTGPAHKEGYDLLITELDGLFLLEVGSYKGYEVVKKLRFKREAEPEVFERKEEILKALEERMDEVFQRKDLQQKLYANMDEENWLYIEKRCLACTSCTQVCPTCFCFDVVEENDINMKESKRVRVWDSCFNPSFATVHKFNLRQSVHSRYRQWLMHKFAYWVDQFGTFGCVGCGRCITWCPAGIDIRQEVKRLAGY